MAPLPWILRSLVKKILVESGGNGRFRHEIPKVIPRILTCFKYTAFPRWILMFSGVSTVGEKNMVKVAICFQRWKRFTLRRVSSYFSYTKFYEPLNHLSRTSMLYSWFIMNEIFFLVWRKQFLLILIAKQD